jgi:hypothetical protein
MHAKPNSVALEPEGSSLCSQVPSTGLYSEPTESTLPSQPLSLISVLIASSHLRLGLPSGLFPSSRSFLC